MKIWFLTRSLYPYQKTGGAQIRLAQIETLKKLGWNIIVVIPNYDNSSLEIVENIIRIPFKKKHIQKLSSLYQRTGFYEDYLDEWIEVAFDYLQGKVGQQDILFATTGGELSMIKLGALLKKELRCKFIVNFHDPINYTLVHGLKVNSMFHVSREKQELKYLQNSDFIVTSSKSNQKSLQTKYPHLNEKIVNNYFGYIKAVDIHKYKKKSSQKLRIAYSGSMLSDVQMPEILYSAYLKLEDKSTVEIYFIGDISQNKILKNIDDENIIFTGYLPHDEYLKFMIENIDVGFVSLAKDYYSACVPSKIYEYINLGLPMLGALPDGDSVDIINNNNYGIACRYDNSIAIVEAISKLMNPKELSKMQKNLFKDRGSWSMKNRILEVDTILRDRF